MDENYRKFRIHFDLKEYENALEMIAKTGAQHIDEAINLIKKQRLFKQALELYSYDAALHI
jgi:hypothetical protein